MLEFYNSDRMRQLRSALLDGQSPPGCSSCYYQDKFGKLSGRTRQLLKSGVQIDDFDRTMRSSPHYQQFLHSHENSGHGDYQPVDLQIDLGNVCNSACIMCDPVSSSRLHTDYIKLHKINSTLFENPSKYTSWTQNLDILDCFIAELIAIPNLKYIHFLGGETLYDEAFYTICDRVIAAGISKNIIIGTTTNGTIHNNRIDHLISQFKEFHLGISIEAVSSLNDYIRYPGKIDPILSNIDKFLALRSSTGLYVSLRITPNIFTISEIDQLFEYMIEKNVIAESCNILFKPECLRIELLPENIRQQTIDKLDQLIVKYKLIKTSDNNIRKADAIADVIGNVVIDYQQFLAAYTVPKNVDILRQQLVTFLKSFESLRNNSILDHAPNYTEFLRHYGY
jgi:sulfatase maturation enzyme AslB (radical SAM superfamily)